MKNENVIEIEIWSRGKNRDMYGNPYLAWIAKVYVRYVSYFSHITIHKDMMGGDSYESACLKLALQGINEALGTDIRADDKRIVHHYKHTCRDSDLIDPTKWKI